MPDTVSQERTISGRGIFRINDDFRECKRIILYADIVRNPSNPYDNVTWNPSKGFYANLTLSYQGSVMLAIPVNFPSQGFIIHQNDSQQLGSSLVCALDNILDSFVQYAASQGIPYIKNNSIRNHEYSAFIYDQARFVCYSGTAIALRLIGEKTDKCNIEDARSYYPPPPPPPTQPLVPPGNPVVVSLPYPDESLINPDTQPDPIDEQPPLIEFPFGVPCELYNVRAVFTRADGLIIDQTVQVSGRVIEKSIIPVNDGTSSISYGVTGEQLDPSTGICDQQYRVQFVSSPDGVDFDVLSITPVSSP